MTPRLFTEAFLSGGLLAFVKKKRRIMKVTAIVEKGSDGLYSIYTEAEVEGHGLGGFGSTVAEAKADFMESVEEAKGMAAEEGGSVPGEWESVEVEYRYDIESFFNYFDWINVTQFARHAGINESKMRQYKSGLAFAGERTMKKIMTTIRRMGAELCAASV